MRRYWIGVVTRDHAERAVAGGFVQLNHGRAAPLERMRPGDGLALYCPRTREAGGEPLQAFAAIGCVAEAPLERADGPDGEPWFRRGVRYLDAHPASIRPLLDALSFIRNRTHWGVAFRFGFLGVPEQDFERIAEAMGRRFCDDFPPPSPASSRPAAASAGVSSG